MHAGGGEDDTAAAPAPRSSARRTRAPRGSPSAAAADDAAEAVGAGAGVTRMGTIAEEEVEVTGAESAPAAAPAPRR